MASSTRRTGPGLRRLIERRAKETARNTIRTGWSTEMGASAETVKIAIINAFGADLTNGGEIPARPTLEPTMLGMRSFITAENKAIARTVNRGADPTPLMDRLAGRLESKLREEVVDLSDPPNAASTIATKGFDDPLVGAGSNGGRLVRELASRRVRK